MDRRRFLKWGATGASIVAGCTGQSEPGTDSQASRSDKPRKSTGNSPRPTESATNSPTQTATPQQNPDTIFVSPGGSDSNEGTRQSPLETVQSAIDIAEPGETVFLTAGIHTSGDPERPVGITRRAGEPNQPITITGPPDAVVKGPPVEMSSKPLFHITHSHIHLTGMTLDGLTKPDAEGEPRWYRQQLIDCNPPTWQDSFPDYLTDVVIKPGAVGNARTKLINAWRTSHLEIGEFEVIGPAGVEYYFGQQAGYVLGAIVSLGRSPNNFGTSHYPWEEPDESHDIHIHHIANIDGYRHTELVKPHAGNYDVTIEYCTDAGGATRESITMPGGRSTIRWCELHGSERNGIRIRTPPFQENGTYEFFESIPEERFPGVNNAVYGNQLSEHASDAIAFVSPEWIDNGPADQLVVCGNTVDGESTAAVGDACPEWVPEDEGTGHTGGNSPWN